MSKIPDLVSKCLKTDMHALALTDHGNMYGIKEFLDHCKKVNKEAGEIVIKPIVGCEAYCARRGRHSRQNDESISGEGRSYVIDRSGWHLILLAKNMQGYRNLCKIVSMGFMDDAFNYTPRIDKELLEQYHEGIICSSACLGGELPQKIMTAISRQPDALNNVEQAIANGVFQEAEEAVQWFKNLFGEDYYIELQRHQTEKPGGDQSTYQRQMQVNPVLIALAHKYGIKVIATNDAHFVEEEHAEAHDRLICLSTNHFVDDINRMHYTKQEWLKSPAEMEAIFSDIPEAITNTQEIADKVEIYDIDSKPIMPKFPIPEEFGTEEQYGSRLKLEAAYLEHLTMEGALKRYGKERLETDEQLKERIRFELDTINNMGFPGYFLIVMDFIRGAREELGVSVGPGRGSAAGSVVAYCLHITDLDPLEYDLLFERFLNPDRISLPDIDTDFDDAGRGRVLEWVSKKYGETHVAHIITYGVMAAKSAIADVSRIQRVPLERANQIKALIPERGFPDNIKDEKGKSPKVNLKNCYKYVDELRQLVNGGEPEIRSMLNYAQQLEGTVRQVGIHACGVIIGADDLTNFAPLSSVEDKELHKRVLVTEYDGHVIESVGLIKMDFLGLKTLTIINECIKNIKRARGEEVDIDHIPIDDAETYKLFQEGRTIAVFQFESAGMQKYMKELKPTVIGDLIAMNALYRPGPMQYIPQFIRRKQGLEPVTYDIPCMEKYLKDTYGVTVYQEQVMLLSRLLANFTRGESDKLRKAMGKKQMNILQELKGKFMEGGKANGHDPKVLEKIWTDWEAFASYAFNKSHAACYSWVAYQTAYLKAHYPAEFMAANLTVSKDDIKEVTKFMDECKAMRINVLEPDINESELNFTVNKNGDIRFGLGGVKGIGEAAVEAIVQEREANGKYKDIFDFLERVNLQACNKKTVESLALSGAFDCFEGIYREQLIGINEKGEIMLDVLMRYGNTYQQDKAQQQNSLFGDMGIGVDIAKPTLPKVEHMSTIERLNKEKNLIGIFLSAHPLDEYEFEINDLCDTTAEELNRFEGWRSSSARAAAANPYEDEADADSTEEKIHIDPKEWISKRENQPLHFGGIVASAEEAISQKGNPYGRYVIEDYTGSYKLTLFGEAYKSCAPLLKPNLYVYVTGTIQQRGANRQYFRPKPYEDAEYEFAVMNVELLKDVQAKHVETITLRIPVEQITKDFNDELTEQIKKHPGHIKVKIQVFDETKQNLITFVSQSNPISVDKDFYHWLRLQELDGIMSHKIN